MASSYKWWGTSGKHNVRISKKTVQGIKQDLDKGSLTQREIAENWGVSKAYVSEIKRGKVRRDG